MEGRRTLIWGGAVATLALVSLGGAAAFNGGVVGMATGGSGGCNGAPATVPETVPDNVLVAEPVGLQGTARPEAIDAADWVVEGEFLIMLSEDAIASGVVDSADGPVLSSELRVELDAIKALNPTFAFHDRDSDLISHHMDGAPKAGNQVVMGGLLPPIERIVVLEVDGDPNVVIPQLEALEWVEWAEQVGRMEVATTDSLAGYQWNVDTLQIPSAHKLSVGEGVLIGVVDTGVQAYTDGFRDLRSDLCLDSVDNDLVCDDPNGHGSHMAGVIAQQTGNDIGTVGIAPAAALIPVRVADADGFATSHAVANGIVYAVDAGARVVSVGLGGYAESKTLMDAVEYAERMGAIVVAPAGNDGLTGQVMIPARLNTVIGVGCVDMSAEVCGYSNRGPGVDIYAPGGTVSLDDDGDGLVDGVLAEGLVNGRPGFVVREGTSVSSAHVAGAAALLIGLETPTERMPVPTVVREILVGTRDPVSGLAGKAVATGMISPLAALERLRDLPLGQKAEGEECQAHAECGSGVCEGQGCGETAGSCAPDTRSCTLDLRPYCGCDDETFYASGSCSMQRYTAEGACEG